MSDEKKPRDDDVILTGKVTTYSVRYLGRYYNVSMIMGTTMGFTTVREQNGKPVDPDLYDKVLEYMNSILRNRGEHRCQD